MYDRPMTFDELFCTYAALASERKRNFKDFLKGNSKVQINLSDGYFDVGDVRLRMGLLGTVDKNSDYWVWAWANEHEPLSAEAAAPGLVVRSFGQNNGISELTAEAIAGGVEMGHKLAAVAVGLNDAQGYIEVPLNPPLIGFLLIVDDRVVPSGSRPLDKLIFNFSDATQTYGISDQRAAIIAYAQQLGLEVKPDGSNFVCIDRNHDEELVVEFDEQDRMIKMKTRRIGS